MLTELGAAEPVLAAPLEAELLALVPAVLAPVLLLELDTLVGALELLAEAAVVAGR